MNKEDMCPFCPKAIQKDGAPRVTCEDHVEQFMMIKRDKMKPTNFQKAYYRQKRRPAKAVEIKTSGLYNCLYCNTQFQRTGLERFCPGSRCSEKWEAENPLSTDYSLINKKDLKKLYYKENLSLKAIADWYRDNKNLRITHDTIRSIMLKFDITWDKKQRLLASTKKD